METKNEFISYLENLSLFLLGILFLTFPLAATTLTTDAFSLPKQAILGFVAFVTLAFLSVRMVLEGTLRIHRTPFDLPIVLFTIALSLSSFLAVNRADSLITFVIFLFAVVIYFVIVNIVRDKKVSLFLLASLVAGGVIASVVYILSFSKIYILPALFTHNQTFTPLGSLLDQAIYLALLLPIALYLAFAKNSDSLIAPASIVKNTKLISFGIASLIILIGFIITGYQLLYVQKPTILPFETSFQTAFAAISQQSTRTLQGFLLGSGFGTYSVDFTRFKQASFNLNPTLWSFTFFRASSFVLELLATTGVLGVGAFIFLILKVIREIKGSGKNFTLLSLLLAFAAAFFLPISFIIQTLLFILLGLFCVYQGFNAKKQERFFDIELQLVAFRKGLLLLEAPQENRKSSFIRSKLLPIVLTIMVFVFVLLVGKNSLDYIRSDIGFQKSLVAIASNKGQETYTEQAKAIATFKHRDGYYRVFSQTNFALANSIAAQQPKGATPSAATQQTITTLIQQSINAARGAVLLSPQTALNWQNLSITYRNLIGFGQNAENFAIVSQQQAILLDPNNPQQYLSLGGIYFQLGQWDNAQNQFQIAIQLKPDFPNAYYNLGHAMQQKNDIKGALAQYEIVKLLVANTNPLALKQVTDEIKALSSNEKGQTKPISQTKSAKETSLEIDKSSSNLPPQSPKVKIPPPINATESAR